MAEGIFFQIKAEVRSSVFFDCIDCFGVVLPVSDFVLVFSRACSSMYHRTRQPASVLQPWDRLRGFFRSFEFLDEFHLLLWGLGTLLARRTLLALRFLGLIEPKVVYLPFHQTFEVLQFLFLGQAYRTVVKKISLLGFLF